MLTIVHHFPCNSNMLYMLYSFFTCFFFVCLFFFLFIFLLLRRFVVVYCAYVSVVCDTFSRQISLHLNIFPFCDCILLQSRSYSSLFFRFFLLILLLLFCICSQQTEWLLFEVFRFRCFFFSIRFTVVVHSDGQPTKYMLNFLKTKK